MQADFFRPLIFFILTVPFMVSCGGGGLRKLPLRKTLRRVLAHSLGQRWGFTLRSNTNSTVGVFESDLAP